MPSLEKRGWGRGVAAISPSSLPSLPILPYRHDPVLSRFHEASGKKKSFPPFAIETPPLGRDTIIVMLIAAVILLIYNISILYVPMYKKHWHRSLFKVFVKC